MTLRNHYIHIEKTDESDHPGGQPHLGYNGDETRASAYVDEVRRDCYLCDTLGTGSNVIKRVGFLLKVKADRIEEYKHHHESVWPEMLEALFPAGLA